jgi:hypothetical protein
MSTGNQSWDSPSMAPIVTTGIEQWYAVHTRARHERVVAHRLHELGVNTFLPMVTEVHRWSDRRKSVELATLWLLRVCETGSNRRRAIAGAAHRRCVQVCGRSRIGNANRRITNRGSSNPDRAANTLECTSFSSDRTARASSRRRIGRSRRDSACSK